MTKLQLTIIIIATFIATSKAFVPTVSSRCLSHNPTVRRVVGIDGHSNKSSRDSRSDPLSKTTSTRKSNQIQLFELLFSSSMSLLRQNTKCYDRNISLCASANNENNNNDNKKTNKASVSLSSALASPSSQEFNSPTAIFDYILSLLISDLGSILIGSIGLLLALFNRLSTIDFDSTAISTTYAESINIQSRNDLLAVFASGAVLLNGISKLDVTSVLAESVVLNGYKLDKPIFLNVAQHHDFLTRSSSERDVQWAMEAILSSTPAKTAVILSSLSTSSSNQQSIPNTASKWVPIVMAGTVPSNFDQTEQFLIPKDRSTPILDRFLKQADAKESYLPTLQALPGKVEFTYLPDNTQEALLLPIQSGNDNTMMLALVLGSDTAKSFTPRDVAWCQVIAKRIGDKFCD